MDNLNKDLRDCAIRHGLCQQWQSDWDSNRSQQELIDMGKRGFDFMIKHDYPSVEFMKENFDRKLLNNNLIFIDEHINVANESGVYIINGMCSGDILIDNFNTATINIRHASNIRIVAKGLSRVFVRLYDNSKVSISQYEEAKVYVYRRSDSCVVVASGQVLIRG